MMFSFSFNFFLVSPKSSWSFFTPSPSSFIVASSLPVYFAFKAVNSSIFLYLSLTAFFKFYIYFLWFSFYLAWFLRAPVFSFMASSSSSHLRWFLWEIASAFATFFSWRAISCSNYPIFLRNFFFSSSSSWLADKASSSCFLLSFSSLSYLFKADIYWTNPSFENYNSSHFLFCFDSSRLIYVSLASMSVCCPFN